MQQPLAGLKVLELARILAGPWAGQTLADLGADVVKVESPQGDDTRSWGPPFVPAADGGDLSAAYFHACNRGKRSIVADFTTDEGRALVIELARSADVIIENFKVGGSPSTGWTMRRSRRSTRGWSTRRSPASGRMAPMPRAPATTF
jgi:crotonobetainyl-CoA:carnitine CoA-transferase CaiB-like acyl-CoA transferase